ncbi:MAG: hypothetical protein A2W05_04960 [Candidatus Schekmanbacteria bacterium RBG_16_38_10]|uniref:DUF218 domain-containing protein n=1 Tax=Candidatus Schekmanbacteria bacterium RBG_16_38_10 TaxID=1817879 RepID=A0A1F7RNT9_9BACT|nr:MAG: hypothetical protein A2W05_04960 [Candidatus Schekmanbacteria bacterium RBG_16_38_10]
MLNFRKITFRIVFIAVLFLFFSAISLMAINSHISNKYVSKIYSINDVPHRYVALVLGAKVWSQELSDILEDRLLTAISLYRGGKVEKLLLSGDHGKKNYDEVNAMKRFVVERGVDEEDIFMDHAGFRTYDSCYRARDVFGVNSMVVITNKFHLPRALYIANELGIDAIGVSSDLRRYRSENTNNMREFLADGLAYFDITILQTKPEFLGPRIDISGNGLITQD